MSQNVLQYDQVEPFVRICVDTNALEPRRARVRSDPPLFDAADSDMVRALDRGRARANDSNRLVLARPRARVVVGVVGVARRRTSEDDPAGRLGVFAIARAREATADRARARRGREARCARVVDGYL